MTKLQSEIRENSAEVAKDNSPAAAEKLQRLSDILVDKIGGGWVDAFGQWSRRF